MDKNHCTSGTCNIEELPEPVDYQTPTSKTARFMLGFSCGKEIFGSVLGHVHALVETAKYHDMTGKYWYSYTEAYPICQIIVRGEKCDSSIGQWLNESLRKLETNTRYDDVRED